MEIAFFALIPDYKKQFMSITQKHYYNTEKYY